MTSTRTKHMLSLVGSILLLMLFLVAYEALFVLLRISPLAQLFQETTSSTSTLNHALYTFLRYALLLPLLGALLLEARRVWEGGEVSAKDLFYFYTHNPGRNLPIIAGIALILTVLGSIPIVGIVVYTGIFLWPFVLKNARGRHDLLWTLKTSWEKTNGCKATIFGYVLGYQILSGVIGFAVGWIVWMMTPENFALATAVGSVVALLAHPFAMCYASMHLFDEVPKSRFREDFSS